MAKNNHIKKAQNEPTPTPQISTRQALITGRMAICYLLWGSPPLETFDPHELEAALAALSHMSKTLEPLPLLKVEGDGSDGGGGR